MLLDPPSLSTQMGAWVFSCKALHHQLPNRSHCLPAIRVLDVYPTHRPLSNSFSGLPFRVLNINHKKELLGGPMGTL